MSVNNFPEILLVDMSGLLLIKKGLCSVIMTDPMGLFSLEEISPERIKAVIVSDMKEFLADLSGCLNNVKVLIIQFSLGIPITYLKEQLKKIRQILPDVVIGASYCPQLTLDGLFDFLIRGTGRSAILKLLRGEKLYGLHDKLQEDLLTFLPHPRNLPTTDLDGDCSEKWVYKRTIEIYQPWLGLLSHTSEHLSWPGVEWIVAFVKLLKMSG